jgi:ATP-dependent Clp protease, protease subunit
MTPINFGFDVRDAAGTLDINVYDVIGENWDGSGVKAADVAKQVSEAKNVKQINLYINSQGGSVFDAMTIYNVLNRAKARKVVHVDGAAISAASVLAMIGDEINIAENGLMMIHDPWSLALGTADDMRKTAESLDVVKKTIVDTYAARTGNTAEQVSSWMSAETWMSADDAIERHFADNKTDAKKIAAEFDPNRFRNAPQWVRDVHLINSERSKAMSESKTPETPAPDPRKHFDALNAEFADKAFVAEMFAADKTVDEAKAEWSTREIANLRRELEEAKAALAKKPEPKKEEAKSTAVAFAGDKASEKADFMTRVKQLVRSEGKTWDQARKQAADENPESYSA